MATKSHTTRRAEDLKVLIATAKIKNNLTEEKLAKKLNTSPRTFRYWKKNMHKFPVGMMWLLEVLAEK